MLRPFTLILAYCLFSLSFCIEAMTVDPSYLLNTWIWEKSVGGACNPYVSSPKTIGYNKKVVFTSQGRVITYKNNVEIRNNPYNVEKGFGYADHLEHELISFEGTTYIIENIDNHNLTILTNDAKAARTIYRR